jgi:hypothetical protein
LLLERESGEDVTVDIGDISVLTNVRKSKFWEGAGLGLLIGGGIGAGIGAVSKQGSLTEDYGRLFVVALGAGFLGGIGILIGSIVGVISGKDKTIQIEGKSDSEIQEILEKLRKKARVKNAQ